MNFIEGPQYTVKWRDLQCIHFEKHKTEMLCAKKISIPVLFLSV